MIGWINNHIFRRRGMHVWFRWNAPDHSFITNAPTLREVWQYRRAPLTLSFS
jgi:hypothetical protein